MNPFRRREKSILLAFILMGTSAALLADVNRWSKIGPDGGDVLKLIMDPQSSQTIYAITNNAGLFKTTDGGAQWKSIDADLPDYAGNPPFQVHINGLAICTQNTSILYAGIGEKGLYRSLNGGDNWTFRSLPEGVGDIAVSPVNDQVVFAATSSGVLKSTDAGQTWIQVYSLTSVRFLRFDPSQPETLYAFGEKVGKSIDGGDTWSDTSSGYSGGTVLDVAFDPQNSSNIYLLGSPYLFHSTDGGSSWVATTPPFSETIVVDPLDSSVLYLGYLSADPNNFFWNTMKTTDGGQTWSSFVLDRYRMLFDPSNPNVVYAAAWKKGVFKSTDHGRTWAFSSQGIRKLVAGSLAFAPAGSLPGFQAQSIAATLYVGCPVGVLKSFDAGAHWQSINDDLTNKKFSDLNVEDASGTKLQAAIMTVSGGMSFSPGGVYRSVDGGVHWTGLNEGLTARDVRRLVRTASQSPLGRKAATSAQASVTLYAATGGGGVFKSSDEGANWTPKNEGLSYLYLDDLVLNPDNQNILFAANYFGVFKSENGAETWTSTGLTTSTSCLAIDSRSPAILYAGTSSGLLKSEDGGITWKNRSTGLGNVLVTGIDINPNDSLKIIAGTSSAGVFQSLDGAVTWSPLNLGLDNMGIKDVVFDRSSPTMIYAGTDGDGLYAMTIAPAPKIAVDKTRLNFGMRPGGAVTPSQTVRISNVGNASLNWTAVSSSPWIQCTPASGTDNAQISVSINSAGLAPGAYTGTISIQDPLALNSPQTIAVAFHLYESGTSSQVPFGYFETPLEVTGALSGSVSVSGWTLDDIGVQSVKIFRDPIGGEPTGLVFIGEAVFVEGARPDVELTYPGYPFNYRAGWGYMLLTNFLPDSGNGTFTLHAIATDWEGHQTELGWKTIICDNRNAVKPFGAMDTPAQGGSASGTAFINFGWALTPLPKNIPLDGSTITVWVDGLPLGHPTYNNYRIDIATLFPGYMNSNGAVGYYSLDTTTYEDKVHTIVWSVTDSEGAVDGIGSRYFQIFNTESGVGPEAASFVSARDKPGADTGGIQSIEEIKNTISDVTSPVYVRRGYFFDRPGEPFYPDSEGMINVSLSELERVTIYLNPAHAWETREELIARGPRLRRTNRSAFLLVGLELRPLPIGASFDAERGVLYWQPGPGFLGAYRFIFIDSATRQKKAVTVVIGPENGSKK